jgi:hypothetical protein
MTAAAGCRPGWEGRPSGPGRPPSRRARRRGGGWPAAAGWRPATRPRPGRGDAEFDATAGADLAPGHRVVTGRKADQGVLADPAGVPVTDHIGLVRQRTQRGPVPFGAHGNDLAVGAVHLSTPDRQPGRERGVQLAKRGEAAASQHVAADDLNLAFHPPLGLGSVWGGQPDREVVVAGERDRLRMQRGGLPAAHMAAHHRLGPVIDDLCGHPAEVGERPPVAVPEGAQVLGGGEAAERVAGIRQGHVEARHPQRSGRGLDLALVAPVDLGLGASQDLEATVEPHRLGLGLGQAGPVLPDIDLDPLIVAGKAVLGDQPLPDHRGLELRLAAQPGVDQVGVRVDQARAGPAFGRRRRARSRIGRQIAFDGPPVIAGLPGDLGPGGPGLGQGLEGTQVHPLLLREDHELPSSARRVGPYRAEDGLMTSEQGCSPRTRTYTSSRTPNDM